MVTHITVDLSFRANIINFDEERTGNIPFYVNSGPNIAQEKLPFVIFIIS